MDKENDLIIGGIDGLYWKDIKYWINSINQSGFIGKKVLVVYDTDKDTKRKITENGFEIIEIDLPFKVSPYVERFGGIADYLDENKFRYVITTDVRDVIMQRNPIEFIESNPTYKLICSAEDCDFTEEWNKNQYVKTFGNKLYEKIKRKAVYNVGILAGKYENVRDICRSIHTISQVVPAEICDQAIYNFLISLEPYVSTSLFCNRKNEWSINLGITLDFNSNWKGEVINENGDNYYFVHQWDRIRVLANYIFERYKK